MKQDLYIRSPRGRSLVCPRITRDSLSEAFASEILAAIPAKRTS
jgi:hypothetical protein